VYDKRTYFDSIGYKPHTKQWLYHDSRARFRLPNCGRRFGKSTMAGRDLEPRLFEPNKMFWIVGPTYDLGEKEFRVIWNDLIVKKALGRDKRVKKAYNKKQGNMFLEFPWQTRLEVRSADHPENLVGEALDHVIMSEAAKHKEETWERFIRPALADRRGGADFPTTPEGFNWLWTLWMYGKDNSFPEYESWRFPAWDNDAVYPGGLNDPEILLLKRTMMPERFDQEIAADFSSFAGKIFPEWDAGVHVGNVDFRPELPNYIAFDWGYTNPLAAVEFQVTPNDEIRVWREGIDLVRGFMRPRQSEFLLDEYGTPAEGKPALIVDFSCLDLIREMNNYKAPDSVKGRNVPEMGNKVEDHAIDALRYGIVHLFKFGAGSSLADVYGGGSDSADDDGGSFFTQELDTDSVDDEAGFFTNSGAF
jgi:hypothetical protein